MQGEISFFDVDHTITRRATGSHFLMQGIRDRTVPLSMIITMIVFYFRYRRGELTQKELDRELPFLRGKKREELEALAQRTFDTRMKRDLRPDIEELIRLKVEAGERVVLATSSVEFLVMPLARYLGITDILSSRLEFDDQGRTTGKFLSLPCFEEEKRRAALSFLEKEKIDPAQAAFYSDNTHDLPLLTAVGHPVAVYPDSRLLKTARIQGWEILGS